METSRSSSLQERRDIINFIQVRSANPGDDLNIGQLLTRTFRDTYLRKLPDIATCQERETELGNVESRRRNGVVRVIEFGYRVIGTYALVHPDSDANESWTDNTCTLRCLAIDPEFHSLKLSTHLLDDAVKLALAWKVGRICLHVQQGADGVGRLYEDFGFKRDRGGDKLTHGHLVHGYLLEIGLAQQPKLMYV